MKRVLAWSPFIISIVLFIIPLFWLTPGTLDLGGDGSRLYFLDAVSYLKHYSLYGISPSNIGGENIGYATIPIVVILAVLQHIGLSKTFIASAYHGMAVSFSFLFTYLALVQIGALIRLEKRQVRTAALLGGVLYALSPISTAGWDKVLLTHDKVFLNPLIFYLLVKYIKTGFFLFPALILIVTWVFSINFSYGAAPGLVSFYPVVIVFFGILTRRILKKPIVLRHVIIGGLLFLCLHSFHLLPQIQSIFSPDSVANSAIFSSTGKFDRGLNYFNGIVKSIKVSENFLLIPQMAPMHIEYYVLILLPLAIIGGFLTLDTHSRVVKRFYALSASVFLFLFYFASANITDAGVGIYRLLFSLPGFSMFRNFHGQWISAFFMFYVLLFFLGIAVLIPKIKKKTILLCTGLLVLLLAVSSFSFVKGDAVNPYLWQSRKVRIAMDPSVEFLEAIERVRVLSRDGRVLTLPLTDPSYQIIAGKTTGAYQGPSVISYLAGRQDFSGIAEFGMYQSQIVKFIQRKDYESFKKILGLLGVRYVFYDSDPRVYDAFPKFPYDYVRTFMPPTSRDYITFLDALGLQHVWSVGTFHLYKLDDSYVAPEMFVSTSVIAVHGKDLSPSVITGQSDEQEKTVVVEAVQEHEDDASDVYVLQPNSKALAMLKNPDPPSFLHYSFAKTSPQSWMYPAVRIKEQRTSRRIPFSDVIRYIDRRLFLSAKRMYELEKWADDLKVHEDVQTIDDLSEYTSVPPDITQYRDIVSFFTREFGSWESLISSYEQGMNEAIAAAQAMDHTSMDFTHQTYLINQYLIRDHGRLSERIRNSTLSESEKEYLYRMTGMVFDDLQDNLALQMLDTYVVEYGSLSPSLAQDTYVAELLPDQTASFPVDEMNLVTGSLAYPFKQTSGKIRTMPFVSREGDVFSLSLSPKKNELIKNQMMSLVDKTPQGVGGIDSTLRFLSGQAGDVFKLDEWIPGAYYIISFEYQTDDKPFRVRMSEGSNGNVSTSRELLINDFLSSKRWIPYQVVVRAGLDADEAHIQFVSENQKKQVSTLSLRNVSIVHLPQPSLLLRRNTQLSAQPHPKTEVNKISPTRYEVRVTGASAPYYLVLNQLFDTGWNVYPISEKPDHFEQWYESSDSLRSILKRLWYEAVHVPDGTHLLDESRHRRAYGYANAWLIRPDDVGGKDEYTLVIAFDTQRYFYLSSAISFMIGSGLVVYVLVVLYAKRKIS